MVLGGDDELMDKACATILGERENTDAFKFGEWKPREAQVCGRQVSVLKTPCGWLEHLKSYFFFSKRVKSLKNELQYFESLLFPGPHAFLLVHKDVKNSGRENYLLHALSDVFREEVLDYCMVLFINEAKHNNPKKNYCLKMCGGRYHILQNTDESVHQLFKKTEAMAQWKNSDFFTDHLECFRRAENYFETEYEAKMNAMKDRENQLCNELDALESREKQTKEDFQKLNKKLIIYKDREKYLKDGKDKLQTDKEKLQREVEQLKDQVKQLQSNLTEAKVTKQYNVIQREEEVQVKENELHEKQRKLDRRVKELDDRQRILDEREKQLEIRERKVRQRDPGSSEHHQSTAEDPSVAEDKNRPLDECEGELKSREHSQAGESHGIHKPIRRNSKELEPPNMSESRPLHTL
ncbi:uncharacterized protein LOC127160008 [Labeo rohita]|uniref:uncharacterized protein LOC127160008 n=1 Tax=Labeo rohita TaxID=84645 RepID=UPI0021E2B7E9|nr:uncharacterized protein LOC127160008 [Labeo rohita]XP_050958654.1 uncharacterized protein LOC127160008 [Labeo rohita]